MQKNTQNKEFLKRYLSYFAVKLTTAEIDYCKNNFCTLDNYCFVGDRAALLKLGCFMLLNFGLKRYEFYKSMEAVDVFLGKDATVDPFEAHSPSCELLIIYHLEHTPKNLTEKIEEIINYYVSERAFSGLNTIILSETKLNTVKNNSNLKYVNLEEQ